MADVEEEIYAVIASIRYSRDGDMIPTTVKLARGRREAQEELRRMVGVVLAEKAQVEMGKDALWASVDLKDGIRYTFTAQKTSWAKDEQA